MAALPNPRSERGIDCRLRADRARCGSVETTPGSQAWPPRSIFDWRRDRRADWCRAAAVDLPRGSPGCDRDHPRRVQRVQLVAAEARLGYRCRPGGGRRRRYPQRRDRRRHRPRRHRRDGVVQSARLAGCGAASRVPTRRRLGVCDGGRSGSAVPERSERIHWVCFLSDCRLSPPAPGPASNYSVA